MHLLDKLNQSAEKSEWLSISEKLHYGFDKAKNTVPDIAYNLKKAGIKDCFCFYDIEDKNIYVGLEDSLNFNLIKTANTGCSHINNFYIGKDLFPDNYEDRYWVPVKKASSTVNAIAQATGIMPGLLPANPLVATLLGAVLGTGIGGGAGWLGAKFLGKDAVDEKKLTNLGMILGGLGGSLPGAYWGSVNYREDPENKGSLKSLISSWPHKKANSYIDDVYNNTKKIFKTSECSELFKKAFDSLTGTFDTGNLPIIPRNNFGQVVWQDENTPFSIRAATNGLLDSASMLSGNTNWVSPVDVARIGIGMGSGYYSSLLVGKTLGALAGLSPNAQEKLQQAGTWAGLLTNVVPKAFGIN